MFPQHLLLLLPIHLRTEKRYYSEQEKYISTERSSAEKRWARPFDRIPLTARNRLEDEWFWPPWIFNDIVGFLEIGSDGWNELLGAIYLKRKHFPRKSQERAYRGQLTQAQNHQFLYYDSVTHHQIVASQNETYLNAISNIVKEAKTTIKSRMRTAEIWLPAYNLSFIDFSAADRQLRNKSCKPGKSLRLHIGLVKS